jgi:hypothetical protein
MTTTPATLSTTIAAGGPWPVGVRASANQASAPAGGTGTSSGGWDTSDNRDVAITLINEMRTALIAAGIIKGSA